MTNTWAKTVTWDQYDHIYRAEEEEVQRIAEELQRHVEGRTYGDKSDPCAKCSATIDDREQWIEGVLCDWGRRVAQILEEHGDWELFVAGSEVAVTA